MHVCVYVQGHTHRWVGVDSIRWTGSALRGGQCAEQQSLPRFELEVKSYEKLGTAQRTREGSMGGEGEDMGEPIAGRW